MLKALLSVTFILLFHKSNLDENRVVVLSGGFQVVLSSHGGAFKPGSALMKPGGGAFKPGSAFEALAPPHFGPWLERRRPFNGEQVKVGNTQRGEDLLACRLRVGVLITRQLGADEHLVAPVGGNRGSLHEGGELVGVFETDGFERDALSRS